MLLSIRLSGPLSPEWKVVQTSILCEPDTRKTEYHKWYFIVGQKYQRYRTNGPTESLNRRSVGGNSYWQQDLQQTRWQLVKSMPVGLYESSSATKLVFDFSRLSDYNDIIRHEAHPHVYCGGGEQTSRFTDGWINWKWCDQTTAERQGKWETCEVRWSTSNWAPTSRVRRRNGRRRSAKTTAEEWSFEVCA